ncbi:uncharacterized protein [Rutidosis leptorrhynchoides]
MVRVGHISFHLQGWDEAMKVFLGTQLEYVDPQIHIHHAIYLFVLNLKVQYNSSGFSSIIHPSDGHPSDHHHRRHHQHQPTNPDCTFIILDKDLIVANFIHGNPHIEAMVGDVVITYK